MTSVTSIENVLVSGVTSNTNVTVGGEAKSLYTNAVGPGFLETMGMRLLAGRAPGTPEVRSQTAQIDDRIGRERVFAWLLTIFGAFALLLVSIGLHGVTAYSVSRRTHEIGVRIALGAEPKQVLWMVLRQVAWLATAGLVVGVPLGFAASPLLGTLLFGVAPTDGATMAVGDGDAERGPAGRLPARMNPLVALRRE